MSAKVIDLFAGAGGFSTGAKMAGCDVVWAANHWPTAVRWHAANHPETEHACQDLQQADWRDVPAHDIMAASPACQGHSRARGKEMPHHDALRSTAWAVVACAEYHRSPTVVVENVPDFAKWVLYPAWRDAMNRLGYAVAEHFIDSADHGVPQNRDRLFLVATRSKAPLQLKLPRRQHVPVREVIEWDRYPWNPVHTPRRSPNTLRRIAAGRATFGDRFAAPFYGSGSGLTGRSLDRPLGTLTTIDRWAIVDGDRMRMLKISEAKAVMGFPAEYDLPPTQREAMHLLGNAVCPPVARDVFTAILEAA